MKVGLIQIDGKKYVPLDCIIDIDMSVGCHEKINEFIGKLMKEWKDERRKTKKKKTRR